MEALKKLEKFLFIQTAFLGDAILTLPAIQVLKNTSPDCHIDVLCSPINKEIFECSPFVDNVLVIDKKKKHKSIFSLIKFSREIKKNKYSKIYSAHRSFRTSLLVLLTEVKESTGFSNSALNIVYKNLVPYNLSHHEVKRLIDLVTYPNILSNWKIIPIIEIKKEIIQKIESLLNTNEKKKKIAIAPGSVWATKRYPFEKYQRIIKRLLEKGFNIFLIGSKSDNEICNNISKLFNNEVINFAGEFSIIETIAFLKNVDLLVSNDSAPTHMGMCANIPVLTIYCSTIPEFGFYPYNEKSDFVSYSKLKCKPCGIHGFKECPLGHFDCANKLDVEFIIEKILYLIGEE